MIWPYCGGASFLSITSCTFLIWTAVQTTRFYLATSNTDPGGLPRDEWCPSGDELRVMQSMLGSSRTWSDIRDSKILAYCRHCQRPRPLRAHHCSDCQRCVLRQDHHCPWVTTCVGYHNQKYFVLFMSYAVLGLTTVIVWVVVRSLTLFGTTSSPQDGPLISKESPWTIITIAMDGILGIALLLSILMLLSYQLWCVTKNTTTIEHFDFSRRKRWAKRKDTKFIYPYDLGWKNNFKLIMGETFWDWFSMTRTQGDGYHEHVSQKFLSSLDKGEQHWSVVDDADAQGKKSAKLV